MLVFGGSRMNAFFSDLWAYSFGMYLPLHMHGSKVSSVRVPGHASCLDVGVWCARARVCVCARAECVRVVFFLERAIERLPCVKVRHAWSCELHSVS